VRENVRESGRESLQRDNDRVTENSFSPLSLSLSLETRARRKNPPEGGREGCVISENFSRALFVREEGRERERERERKSRERAERGREIDPEGRRRNRVDMLSPCWSLSSLSLVCGRGEKKQKKCNSLLVLAFAFATPFFFFKREMKLTHLSSFHQSQHAGCRQQHRCRRGQDQGCNQRFRPHRP